MRTEEEIRKELENAEKAFESIIYCECGCQNDNMDYYSDKIKTLKWVLGEI
jgi:hypothetical protein